MIYPTGHGMKQRIANLLFLVLLLTLLSGCGSKDTEQPVLTPSEGGEISSVIETPASDVQSSEDVQLPETSDAQSAEEVSDDPQLNEPEQPSDADTATPDELDQNIWPQEVMGELTSPGGEVQSVVKLEKGVDISIGGLTTQEVEAYVRAITDLGYITRVEGEDGQGGLIYSGAKDGSTITVIYTVDPEVPDEAVCQVTYEKPA